MPPWNRRDPPASPPHRCSPTPPAVKGNVTFGREFDEERWQQCVDACCLATDLEVLPAGERCSCASAGHLGFGMQGSEGGCLPRNACAERRQRACLATTASPAAILRLRHRMPAVIHPALCHPASINVHRCGHRDWREGHQPVGRAEAAHLAGPRAVSGARGQEALGGA